MDGDIVEEEVEDDDIFVDTEGIIRSLQQRNHVGSFSSRSSSADDASDAGRRRRPFPLGTLPEVEGRTPRVPESAKTADDIPARGSFKVSPGTPGSAGGGVGYLGPYQLGEWTPTPRTPSLASSSRTTTPATRPASTWTPVPSSTPGAMAWYSSGTRSVTPRLPRAASSTPGLPTRSAVTPATLPEADLFYEASRSQLSEALPPDDTIRILVDVPAAGRIALRIDRCARVGPRTKQRPDLFTQVWGESADEAPPVHTPSPPCSPCAMFSPSAASTRRRTSRRPMTPVKALLAQRNGGLDSGVDILFPRSVADASGEPSPRTGPQTLKDAVAAATGIPVEAQKLVLKGRGPLDDDDRRLNEFDFTDGTECTLSLRPGFSTVCRIGRAGRGQRFLSGPSLAHDRLYSHSNHLMDRAEQIARASRSAAVKASRWASAASNSSACGAAVPRVAVWAEPAPKWLKNDVHTFKTVMVATPEWEAQLPAKDRRRLPRRALSKT